MAYISQEKKKSLLPNIKAICKKYGVNATVSVHNHSTLALNIKSADIDFVDNYNKVASKNHRGNFEFTPVADGHIQVNHHCIDSWFDGKANQFMKEIIPAMKGPDWFDESDSQTDYFHVAHYFGISIGKWNKPFVVNS